MAVINFTDMLKYGIASYSIDYWFQKEGNLANKYLHVWKVGVGNGQEISSGQNLNYKIPGALAPVSTPEAKALAFVALSDQMYQMYEWSDYGARIIPTTVSYNTLPTVQIVESATSPIKVQNTTDKITSMMKDVPLGKGNVVELFFTPGLSLQQTLETTIGDSISYGVTNGVTQTDSTGGSSKFSVGVELSVPFGASFSAGAEWEKNWSSSRAVEFSTENVQTLDKTRTDSVVVDINSITPNAQGKYFYGATELIPGQKYYVYLEQVEESVRAPISGGITVYGGKTNAVVDTKDAKWGKLDVAMPAAQLLNLAKGFNYDASGPASYGLDTLKWQYVPSSAYGTSIDTDLTGYAQFEGYTSFKVSVKAAAIPLAKAPAAALMASTSDAPDVGVYAVSTSVLDLQEYADRLHTDGVVLDLRTTDNVPQEIRGSTNGKDLIFLGAETHQLFNFKHSTIYLGDGDDFFYNYAGEDGNSIHVGGAGGKGSTNGYGGDTLYIGGNDTLIRLGEGNTVINHRGFNTQILNTGKGSDIIKITDLGSFVVEDWNYKEDFIQWGAKYGKADLQITYNPSIQAFSLKSHGNVLGTMIADPNNLPFFSADTGTYSGTSIVPVALSGTTDGAFLTSLYAAALDRSPDTPGQAYWTSQILNGADRTKVASSIFTSDEYLQINGSSATDFVRAVYQDLLGRTPDAAGAAYWTKQLDSGAARAVFVESVLHSPEFVQLIGVTPPSSSSSISGISWTVT